MRNKTDVYGIVQVISLAYLVGLLGYISTGYPSLITDQAVDTTGQTLQFVQVKN